MTDPNTSTKLAIIDGIRTPFARIGTGLADLDAVELGRVATSALLTKTGIPREEIDEVIFGCVSQPPDSANVARIIALRAGIPQSVPASSVLRNCASGVEAITTAAERCASGKGHLFVVGGTESMSQIPLFFARSAALKFAALARARSPWSRARSALAFRPSDFAPLAGLRTGLTDPFSGLNMGETAEILAREFGISRDDQDRFALSSHQKASASNAFLAEEICPVFNPDNGSFIDRDNGVRDAQSLDALKRLRPSFDKTGGTVTPGNASQITDGAVALLVASESKARSLGLPILGTLTGYAYSGCDPSRMGLGPLSAIAKVARSTGLHPADADTIELNEAFAAQALAVLRSLEMGPGSRDLLTITNPHGGAIALGHPVGATGARLVLTSLRHLRESGGKRALVTLCVGGGQGAALWLENPNS